MNSPMPHSFDTRRAATFMLFALLLVLVGASAGCGGSQRDSSDVAAEAQSERFSEDTAEYRGRVLLDELTQVIEMNTNPSDELEARVRAFVSANRSTMGAVEQELVQAAEGRNYSERIAYEDAIAMFMNDAMQRYEDALSEVERRDEELGRRIRTLVERATR